MSEAYAASVLRWWKDAGVDILVEERPRNWLIETKPASVPARRPAKPADAAPEPRALPATLAEFERFLAESGEIPHAAPGAPRLLPQGDPASGLMVLGDMPGVGDFDEGRLFSGETGALFDRMMKAISRSRAQLYLVPLLPCRSPSGRFEEKALERAAELARHHVSLVRPKALLILGDAPSRALTGRSVLTARGEWMDIATAAGPVPALVSFSPAHVEINRSARRPAWEDLQRLAERLPR
ncbi:MAG: uracil-DNA glycosylase family protein [Sphingomonadaceae bacterium]